MIPGNSLIDYLPNLKRQFRHKLPSQKEGLNKQHFSKILRY